MRRPLTGGEGTTPAPAVYLVIFTLDEQRYALHLQSVLRVALMAEVTPLPRAPDVVRGIINVAGAVVLVFDVRKRFSLPERAITLSDHLIIARTERRTVALVADAVTGVVERPRDEIVAASSIARGLEFVSGVVKLDDGLVLIHDLETFLSPTDEARLSAALSDPEVR